LKVTWPKAARGSGEFRAFPFSSASSELEHVLWGEEPLLSTKKERDQPDRAPLWID